MSKKAFGLAAGGSIIAAAGIFSWFGSDELDGKKFIDLGVDDKSGKHVLVVGRDLKLVDEERVAELSKNGNSRTFDQMRADFVTRLAGKEGQDLLDSYNKVRLDAQKHEKNFFAADLGKTLTVDELGKMETQLPRIMEALRRQEKHGAKYGPAADLSLRLQGYLDERDVLAGERVREMIAGTKLSSDFRVEVRDQIPNSTTWPDLKGPPTAPKVEEEPTVRFVLPAPGAKP